MPSPAGSELPVCIDIAPDRLSVRLTPRADRVAKALDAPAIIAHLATMGITINPRGEAEIHELCRPRKPNRLAPPVLVAMGTAAVDDLPPYLELIPPLAQLLFSKRYVKAGDSVATLIPARCGSDGTDVFGKPIPRHKTHALPAVDSTLLPAKDGSTYRAAIDGIIRVRGEGASTHIVVLPCASHAGDLCGAPLRSIGEITVEGFVSAASIEAGGAIHVGGDIEKSTATCDGDLTAGELRSATLDVAGDCVALNVFQSQIACGGELIVEAGSIVGGHVIAAGGLRCKSLGAPAPVTSASKTLVEIGVDQRYRRRLTGTLPEIDARLAKSSKIRQMVEPLLNSAQPLTPKQQERLIALLAEAEALDEMAQQQRRELRQDYETSIARCRNEISIAQIVHPGVTIRFPVQTTVRIALRGPCRISLQSKGNEPPRIILSQGNASPIPLESSRLAEDWRAAVEQLAA